MHESPFDMPSICGGTPCCGQSPCVDRDVVGAEKIRNVTRGRKKRKRRPGAGSAVAISGHYRSPRGSNGKKPRVRVDGYKRGKGKRKKKR